MGGRREGYGRIRRLTLEDAAAAVAPPPGGG
jgi:hypothetical protein